MRSKLNFATKLGRRLRLSHLIGALVAVLSVMWLMQSASLIILNIDRGFDITDESYFLLAAKYPEDIAFWVSRFGFYTGALLAAAGGDIGAFRLAGLIILAANCVWFARILRGFAPSLQAEASRSAALAYYSAILGSALAAGYHVWLGTPAYNWLNLNAILIAGSGCLLAAANAECDADRKVLTRDAAVAATLIGVGGALSFIAKPPSAGVLALVYGLWLVLNAQLRNRWQLWLGLPCLIATLCLLVHVLIFERGVMAYVEQLRQGAEFAASLDGGYSASELLSGSGRDLVGVAVYTLKSGWVSLAVLAMAVGGVAIAGARWHPSDLRRRAAAIPVIACTSFWLEIWLRHGDGLRGWSGGYLRGSYLGYPTLGLAMIALVSTVLALSVARRHGGDGSGSLGSRELALPFLLLLGLILAQAFGSNLGIVRQSAFALVLIWAAILHAVGCVDRSSGTVLGQTCVAGLLSLTVYMVTHSSAERPNRLPAKLVHQSTPIVAPGANGRLFVDPETARYIEDLRRISAQAGWQTGNHLIDISGGSPGAALILDARFIGFPWLVGGYAGSHEFCVRALSTASSDELQRAWVLAAPAGKRRLKTSLLRDIGLDPDAYTVVGRVRTGWRGEEQILLRPPPANSPHLRAVALGDDVGGER